MAKKNVDKEMLAGLAKAKELERLPNPSDEEIVAVYKDALEEAEKLNKLLKPAWFIDDTDAPGHARHPTEKVSKKRAVLTKKKRFSTIQRK